ncbi:AAA family ATPase [Candidatus Woesearchaeota archaeon CG11_big_fil_rev_8_21_14_0_20_43_8]|nr:MAG: AAA family ATPase [Candidatus Woesearchaeota archaeon CG11_big_fil_rev_8_21_14_0_20_43_8]
METTEQIRTFQEFLEAEYYEELLSKATKEERFLVIDFRKLTKFSPELAENLLENPTEVLKAGEISIEHIDLPFEAKKFRIRFSKLSDNETICIRDIRSKHIGKFLKIEGVVKQKSDVRPLVTSAKFECPSCGNIIPMLQLDSNFREPSRCGCGRKGKFRLLSKDLVDAQGMALEENPEMLDGGDQPKRLNILLQEDLVSPISDKKTNPGSKVTIAGIIKEIPIIIQGNKTTKFDLIMEGNYLEPLEEDYSQIKIITEEEIKIKELSADPRIFEKLTTSLAPSIYGHERVKEALLLQLFSGVSKKKTDGVRRRGDIHILLIGDPGSGKSQLLKRLSYVAPKARYVSGKGVSGAGLTAAVVKDEFLKGWSLEAGALVLANKGICMIDELDKMSKEDRSAMHEALEQQTVTISKANIQATLRSETTVLAAANPKFGRFDPYEIIAKQIDLPSSLINRFDLIFPVRDLPDKEKDTMMASFILDLHKKNIDMEGEIPTELLRKYISYARQKCHPVLTDKAIEEIKSYYIKMRNSGGSDENNMKAIPISARQLEALIRLAEASAKIRLSPEVTIRDAKRSIGLVHYCLSQIGIDPETGQIDIDRISSGVTASERGKIFVIKNIINELEKSTGSKTIKIDDIEKAAKEKGVSEDMVIEAIEKLKKAGDIFEPKRGFISKI